MRLDPVALESRCRTLLESGRWPGRRAPVEHVDFYVHTQHEKRQWAVTLGFLGCPGGLTGLGPELRDACEDLEHKLRAAECRKVKRCSEGCGAYEWGPGMRCARCGGAPEPTMFVNADGTVQHLEPDALRDKLLDGLVGPRIEAPQQVMRRAIEQLLAQPIPTPRDVVARRIEGGGVALVSESTDFVHVAMTDEAWAYFSKGS